MASKTLFKSGRGRLVPRTDTRNDAGGTAYLRSPEQALAQYVCTGCLGGTYYAGAHTQLDRVMELCGEVSPEFIGKAAVYARKRGFMKDMPALLLAILHADKRDIDAKINERRMGWKPILEKAFPQVVDNEKMLINFVQIVRSGVTGRKSIGARGKRLCRKFLTDRDPVRLWKGSCGYQNPSMADVIRMIRPCPKTQAQQAMFGYLRGKMNFKGEKADYVSSLPDEVQNFEDWKLDHVFATPDVPFQMLTAEQPGPDDWKHVAMTCNWHTARMNLNTFQRHGVLKDREVVRHLAEKLRDGNVIKKVRVFPYQLLTTYLNIGADVPDALRGALHDALELACANVPELEGETYICVDVSGSMGAPITGYRKGSASKTRCVDVAALFAAAFNRKNPGKVRVLPFDTGVKEVQIDHRDTVMTTAKVLAGYGGGGTNMGAALGYIAKLERKADTIVIVSDNESWMDSMGWTWHSSRAGTDSMKHYEQIRAANPGCKLICIDLTPSGNTQVKEREDVINVGGFSDDVFRLVGEASKKGSAKDTFVRAIEEVET